MTLSNVIRIPLTYDFDCSCQKFLTPVLKSSNDLSTNKNTFKMRAVITDDAYETKQDQTKTWVNLPTSVTNPSNVPLFSQKYDHISQCDIDSTPSIKSSNGLLANENAYEMRAMRVIDQYQNRINDQQQQMSELRQEKSISLVSDFSFHHIYY